MARGLRPLRGESSIGGKGRASAVGAAKGGGAAEARGRRSPGSSDKTPKEIMKQIVRVILGMSQAELAARAGIRPNQVSRYETGEVLPQLTQLGRLLGALQLDVVDFFLFFAAVRTWSRVLRLGEEDELGRPGRAPGSGAPAHRPAGARPGGGPRRRRDAGRGAGLRAGGGVTGRRRVASWFLARCAA